MSAPTQYIADPKGVFTFIDFSATEAGQGAGGGTQQVFQDSFADPNGNLTPDDPTLPALYFPDNGGTLWQWNVNSQAWV